VIEYPVLPILARQQPRDHDRHLATLADWKLPKGSNGSRERMRARRSATTLGFPGNGSPATIHPGEPRPGANPVGPLGRLTFRL
jgi:hypothetical protein